MLITVQILLVALSCFQSKPEVILSLSFVDPSERPAQVCIDQQKSEATAGYTYAPNLRETSAEGKIDIVTDDKNEERCCFVYAKGYAIDLLNTSLPESRFMRIRMQPESDISVLVVDKNGKAIPNAVVTPGSMIFRRSAWISNIPHQLPRDFESRTDSEGTAKMRGAIAEDLQSVRVTLDDKRSCTFQIPERWDRTSVLRVVWNVSFGTLVCRLLDPEGKPVPGARLFANTNDEVVNSNVIAEPTAEFSAFLGITGEDGSVTIPDVPATTIDVRVFSPAKSIGRGEYRKDFAIQAGKTNLIEFRQKPVFKCIVSVVDVTDSEFHEGISVRFALYDRVDNINGEARADEDGVCEAELQTGEWRFFVNDATLPDGYCIYYPERSTKFKVVQSEDVQTAPPLYIGKGQLIQGKIAGKDMSEIRFDWISAATKDRSESWYGRVNDGGEFRILVPKHVDLDTISEFAIGSNPVRGTLAIESRAPWVLKWVPAEQPSAIE